MHFHFVGEYVNTVIILQKSSVKPAIFVICNFLHNVNGAEDTRVYTPVKGTDKKIFTFVFCVIWKSKPSRP